jgi:hypothetical protein
LEVCQKSFTEELWKNFLSIEHSLLHSSSITYCRSATVTVGFFFGKGAAWCKYLGIRDGFDMLYTWEEGFCWLTSEGVLHGWVVIGLVKGILESDGLFETSPAEVTSCGWRTWNACASVLWLLGKSDVKLEDEIGCIDESDVNSARDILGFLVAILPEDLFSKGERLHDDGEGGTGLESPITRFDDVKKVVAAEILLSKVRILLLTSSSNFLRASTEW